MKIRVVDDLTTWIKQQLAASLHGILPLSLLWILVNAVLLISYSMGSSKDYSNQYLFRNFSTTS